jgi:serine/threonine protein kinase
MPFAGKTGAAVLAAILDRTPTPPVILNPLIPERLETIIQTCLEKNRERRYQSADQLRRDLERASRDPATDSRSSADRLDRQPHQPRLSRREWRFAILAAASLAVLLVVMSSLFWSRRSPPSSAYSPTDAGSRLVAEDDDAAIRRVIDTYIRAIETKSVPLFQSVKPNLTDEERRRLEDGFKAVSSQIVNFRILSIDRKGSKASVRLARRDSLQAEKPFEVETQQAISLERTSHGFWIIVAIGR